MNKRTEGKPKNNGVQTAVDIVGGTYALAKLCGVAQPTVMKWIYTSCPAERAVQIEIKTGVQRELIRPDVFRK